MLWGRRARARRRVRGQRRRGRVTGDGQDPARPRARSTPAPAPRRPRCLSRASPFPRRGRPAHLSRGMSRARGCGGALASGSPGRRLRRPRSFHPQRRGRAPAPRQPVRAWARLARECTGLRAPGGAAAASRRGARGAHSAALCRREARLGASPSKEKAAPGAEPRPRASPPPPRLRRTERVPGKARRGPRGRSCSCKAR